MSGARMLAEILEQPDVYLETMRRASSWQLPTARVSSIVALGSGSSFNVALLRDETRCPESPLEAPLDTGEHRG